MDTLESKGGTLEIEHIGGAIHLTIDSGDNTVSISLSVVEASQLVSLLHKQINEAAIEKLRTRNA
ncbi:MAG TPA: hypothetical protein VKF81_17545 [Blastocatellia bacterium]|nr:hypothetical protein [Blastocatellia bacterium]